MKKYPYCKATREELIEALLFVQKALANDRDNEPIIHPLHGGLCLEEVKYCVVDPVLGNDDIMEDENE